jgi:hypothetical protein
MRYCAAAAGISTSGFSPASKLGRVHRLLEDPARGPVIQGLMQSFAVIGIEVRGNAMRCLGHVLVRPQVYLFILEGAPEPFDEDVIAEATAPIHADGDAMRAKYAGEVVVGELAALIGVEDLERSLAQRFLQGLDTKTRIEQIRQAPRQHVAAHPTQ